jgi:non-reducing end alpha-L-arabinofuranosidase
MSNHLKATAAVIIGLSLAQQKTAWTAECPCDIYNAAGTPCVAAYSTVRLLLSTYGGPLYQVRRTSDSATMDIYPLTGGTVADAAAHDSFLAAGAGTIAKLYDQSGRGNDLIKAGGGSQVPTPDNESDANGRPLYIRGHKAYALYMVAKDGYRNDTTNGMPTGNLPQGIYEVVDGQRYGTGCCWDFGNAETDNHASATGTMESIFFGTGIWGKGSGIGPWFMNDMEAGVWAGGSGASTLPNNNNPSVTWPYAMGIVKSSQGNYAIRVGSAQSGNLLTAFDGPPPTTWKLQGAIILGIGGDNSNSSWGTFFEGAITSGRPSDATENSVQANIIAAEYGVTATYYYAQDLTPAPLFDVCYNPSRVDAVITYTLQDQRRVDIDVFDQQGRQIASIVSGVCSAGRHKAMWNAKRAPAGVYVCRMAVDGHAGAAEKIIVQK